MDFSEEGSGQAAGGEDDRKLQNQGEEIGHAGGAALRLTFWLIPGFWAGRFAGGGNCWIGYGLNRGPNGSGRGQVAAHAEDSDQAEKRQAHEKNIRKNEFSVRGRH